MEPESKPFALVTGASSGIGKAIAYRLALKKHNLVLCSLPGQSLPDYCRELEKSGDITVYCCELDLTRDESPETLLSFIEAKQIRINILVNNAGIGFEGPADCYSKSQIDYMIGLNIRAVTMLTCIFLPKMKDQKDSYILNISSFGSYLPTAYKSIYLATKSYIYYFTRAVESELNGSGPSVSVAVPSSVITNPTIVDRIRRNGWFSQQMAMSPDEVAVSVLSGMFSGKRVLMPGRFTTMIFRFALFLPEGLILWATRRVFRNYRNDN